MGCTRAGALTQVLQGQRARVAGGDSGGGAGGGSGGGQGGRAQLGQPRGRRRPGRARGRRRLQLARLRAAAPRQGRAAGPGRRRDPPARREQRGTGRYAAPLLLPSCCVLLHRSTAGQCRTQAVKNKSKSLIVSLAHTCDPRVLEDSAGRSDNGASINTDILLVSLGCDWWLFRSA